MNSGERFQGIVRDLSSKGLGVVDHPAGLVFFVKGTWPGDEGTFEVLTQDRRYGFAKLVTLSKPSTERVPSLCAHHGVELGSCGGCPWMLAGYEHQLHWKQKLVAHALGRAKLEPILKSILGSPKALGYRNRAQFKTDGKKLGYVSSESRTLAPIQDCPILTEPMRKHLQTLLSELPTEKWNPTGEHIWNFIEVDEDWSFETFQLNRRRPFQQGNSVQNDRMKEWVKSSAIELGWAGQNTLELFSGSGNLTQSLLDAGVKSVICAESSSEAIQTLEKKKWPGVQGFVVDLYKKNSPRFIPSLDGSAISGLLLDPPRDGYELIGDWLKVLPKLKSILYVSCDLSHFVSDAVKMESAGFKLKEVQALDLFPHTPHVEILSKFVKLLP